MFTHLNKKEQPCGILVNRGWVPKDLHQIRYDEESNTAIVQGVLYRGDPDTKYSRQNTPYMMKYYSVRPDEMALLANFPNE